MPITGPGRRSLLAAAALAGLASPRARAFDDPVRTPAPPTRLVTQTQLAAVARAGARLVAVGIRGLIVVSDDAGRQWRQVPSPVSSDLLAVSFVDAGHGWIAGHDGVLLHSADGGATWVKHLDGNAVQRLLRKHFEARLAEGDERAAARLQQLALDHANGPEQPFLDVSFESRQRGFASGAFGLMLGTEDGGAHWRSWIEAIDAPAGLHLNAVRRIGGRWFIASERGTVYRLEPGRQRFAALATGYAGSLFGLVGDARQLIAYGLRGSAYRSADAGATWQRLATGVTTGLTAGTVLADGRFVLASQSGQLLLSHESLDAAGRASPGPDDPPAFEPLPHARPGLLGGVCEAGEGVLVTVGLGGVQRVLLR